MTVAWNLWVYLYKAVLSLGTVLNYKVFGRYTHFTSEKTTLERVTTLLEVRASRGAML